MAYWPILHKILTDIQARDGQLTNPVSFSSAELLALLKIYKDSGKNYRDVSDWLDVMVGTTIISEGAVYFGGKRTFGKDTFHVFDRAVSFGKQLPNGSIADKNYVWLSEWQLQNINDHHQLPIDLDTYRQLRSHIAKALVPLLQIWLYATRDEGVFEKRYEELCQVLNVRQWNYLSKIKEKLGPSLDELKQFGYLADWQIEKTSDGQNYKIVFYHGEKFHRDRRARQNRKQVLTGEGKQRTDDHTLSTRAEHNQDIRGQHFSKTNSAPDRPAPDPQLVAEFTRRGITEKKASELLANLKPGQDVLAQLELGEPMAQHSRVPIVNPPGFYVRLIESNMSVPDSFETNAKRKAREEREQKERERRDAQEARQLLEWDYDDYCQRETDRYIEENPGEFEAIRQIKWNEIRAQHENFSDDLINSFAPNDAKREIRKRLSLPTFEEFVKRKKDGTIASSSGEVTSDPPQAEELAEAIASAASISESASGETPTAPSPQSFETVANKPIAELASVEILPETTPPSSLNPEIAEPESAGDLPPVILSSEHELRPEAEVGGGTETPQMQPAAEASEPAAERSSDFLEAAEPELNPETETQPI